MSDPQTGTPNAEHELDAAVAEAERHARAEDVADPDERVAVKDDSGRIHEERAQ